MLGAPDARAWEAPAGAAVRLSGAEQVDITSKVTGRAYRVFIAQPLFPAPKEGYPVVYLLDGNFFFAGASSIARLMSATAEARVAVIVGIGYPTESLLTVQSLRMKDLTTPPDPAAYARDRAGTPAELANTGGVDAFLQSIEQEIKPLVAARARIDTSDQTLFGHSLGGLAVLRALFTQPQTYRTFAASSPSIWWSGRSILEGEAAFSDRVRRGEAQPRIFLDVGGLEQTALQAMPGMTLQETQAAANTRFRMVENTRELAARLTALKGGPGYRVVSQVFDGETHISVMPAAMTRALRFALEPGPR